MKKPNIAIDGPAAGGKTTVAALLGRDLEILYLDTGMMYRAAAWLALQKKLPLTDSEILTQLTEQMDLRIDIDLHSPAGCRVFVEGTDITDALHNPEVSKAVSIVAAVSGVRRDLVRRQRLLAQEGGIVMAGRDIGTVVMPEAELKYYLEASLEERARRRWLDLQNSGRTATIEEVAADLRKRDANDANRADSPMQAAADAQTIDCSNLSARQVADLIIKDYQEELKRRNG